jgi:hypothetical protein
VSILKAVRQLVSDQKGEGLVALGAGNHEYLVRDVVVIRGCLGRERVFGGPREIGPGRQQPQRDQGGRPISKALALRFDRLVHRRHELRCRLHLRLDRLR